MKPENKIICGLWIARDGNLLSNMERMCIYSFCANGHDFHLYVYDDIANVPNDTVGGKVKVCDGNKILPASKIFSNFGPSGHPSFAGFSDWFRWELLRRGAGLYVDMDVVCVRPFDFSQDVVFAWDDREAYNGIMKFPATHPLVAAMADACSSPSRIQPWDDRKRIQKKILRRISFWKNPHEKPNWGEAGGPRGFIRALNHFQIPHPSIPAIMFQPYDGGHLYSIIDHTLWKLELLEPMLKNVYSLHLCNDLWNKKGWDKNGTFAEHSPYEVLKRRYLPEYQKNVAVGISQTS